MKSVPLFCLFFLMLISKDSFAQQTRLIIEKDHNKHSKAKEEFYVLMTNSKIKHGPYKKYNYWGKLILEGFYKNNKKDSTWSEFSHSGELLNKGGYFNDVKTGVWEYYNSNELEQKYNYSTNEPEYFANLNRGKASEISIIKNGDTVSIEAERPALFIGGTQAIAEFYMSEIRYPMNAMENNIMGTVYISVVIDENGEPKSYNAASNLGYGLEEESIRALKLLPDNWVPALKSGKPIESVVKIPVKFIMH